MNIIQTFYLDNTKDPFKDSFGWIKPEYHLMSWTLSCMQLHKFYGNIVLYANSEGAKLLIDTLQLPYTEVHTSHNNLKLIDQRLWALPKLFTYSLQEKPFLHIDGDVFLFDKFDENLLQSLLIGQNIEVATDYYTSTQKQLMENFTYFPTCVRNDFDSEIPINAVNAGILGGSDIKFFKQYTREAFKYIQKNKRSFKNIEVDKFNVFFEQHLFYSLAKEQQKEIKFLFDDTFEDRGYLYLGNFHEVPFERTYLHLLGHIKRDEYSCRQMAAFLRELYPEYYYRIITFFRKNNLSLYTNFYHDKAIETTTEYQTLIKNSFESFNKKLSESTTPKQIIIKDSLIHSLFKVICSSLKDEMELMKFSNDFDLFSEELNIVIKAYVLLSDYYLYGRDMLAINWYKQVFGNGKDVENNLLSRTKGVQIIESSYNWAGLFNKNYRIGVTYYEELQILQGEYLNLIIPELTDMGYVMIDIEDIDRTILEMLNEPTTIKEILKTMEQYMDDEVIQFHYNEFQKLILESIKQLILCKAIYPI